MLTYILYGLFILACIVLVVAVLLQPGKADAGALFTSSVSSTAFGPRGTQTLLAKITIGAAALFMLIALMLSLPGLTGTRSVLQSAPAEPSAPQPSPAATTAPVETASPAQEGAAPQSNSNAAADTGTNSNAAATTVTSPSTDKSPESKSSPPQPKK
ncbi:MAG TPA: preprotein translocase subunit SecG [Pyrinomonadaceae bacterium]